MVKQPKAENGLSKQLSGWKFMVPEASQDWSTQWSCL